MQTGQKGKGGMPMNQKGLAAKLVKLNHITHKIVPVSYTHLTLPTKRIV